MRFFFLLLLFMPDYVLSQVNDSFNDGDFSVNPIWQGDSGLFVVNSLSELQLNALDAGLSYLCTYSETIENASWEFHLRMDFNPSSSNYARIYLAADDPVLARAANAVYIEVGSTDDNVCLYKVENGVAEKVIKGSVGRVDVSEVNIRIRADRIGDNWNLRSESGGGWVNEGSCSFNTFFPSSYFGVLCNYTTTRKDKFFFDDFVVKGDAYTNNFYNPQRFGVVFNEVMADPSPSMGLPEVEYVEITNVSDKPVLLHGWSIEVNGKQIKLPTVELALKGYLCFVPASSVKEWGSYENIVAISDWPALTNSECDLVLRDNANMVIDTWSYKSEQMTGEPFKEDGGWSAEKIDVFNVSGCEDNYHWSMNLSGGTPGKENSVITVVNDEEAPEVSYIEMLNDSALQINFSETMMFEDSIEVQFDNIPGPYSLIIDTVFLRYLQLLFQNELVVNKQYEITGLGLTDYEGNKLAWEDNLFFGVADSLEKGDVVINEVLFNPYPGGADFIELYNKSDKIIDISDLTFGDYDKDGNIKKLYYMSDRTFILLPHSYLVLTTDVHAVQSHYACESSAMFEVKSMPSLRDRDGVVALVNQKGQVIDKFEYSDDMHFDLIKDKNGISLERLSVEYPTNDLSNWHSAASTVGYATPGYRNSQVKIDDKASDQTITVTPEVFTPNGNGRDDLLYINYTNDEPDCMVSIRIYDVNGIPVKYLVNNESMSSEGYFVWDGLGEQGRALIPGIYIVWVQRFYPSGKVVEDKLSCVVGVEN